MAQLLVVLYAIGEGVVEHDPCSPFHHVEGSPYDGLILAEDVRFRGERVDSVDLGQDARLAAHVVGLRRDRSERGAAQNALPVPYLQEVRQVGSAGGGLADFEVAFWHVLYVCPQITLGSFEVEGFALPNLYRLAHDLSPRIRPHSASPTYLSCSLARRSFPPTTSGTNPLAPVSATKSKASILSFSKKHRPARLRFSVSYTFSSWRSAKSRASNAPSFKRKPSTSICERTVAAPRKSSTLKRH